MHRGISKSQVLNIEYLCKHRAKIPLKINGLCKEKDFIIYLPKHNKTRNSLKFFLPQSHVTQILLVLRHFFRFQNTNAPVAQDSCKSCVSLVDYIPSNNSTSRDVKVCHEKSRLHRKIVRLKYISRSFGRPTLKKRIG